MRAIDRKIVIKCQFGGRHGWGHLVRSSVLASTLKGRDWQVVLWAEEKAGEVPLGLGSGFDAKVESFAEGDVLWVDEMYTPQDELEVLVETWKERNPNSLVACVDDMQRRSLSGFDLAVNSELGLREAQYLAKEQLLGEQYALVRSEFAMTKTQVTDSEYSQGDEVLVLVMMGGTDPFGVLDLTLAKLASSQAVPIQPWVVAGNACFDDRLLAPFKHSRVIRNGSAEEIAECMRKCSFGILACGSSVFEAAACGLPFVGVSLVDNQEAMARKIEALWGMPVVDWQSGDAELQGLEAAVQRLSRTKRTQYSKVDTKGGERIADVLEVLLSKRCASR